jgi:hypothetical protein
MSFIPASPTLAGLQSEDDIDTLFRRLSQIEPSGEVIGRILGHIRRLPGPLWQQEPWELPDSQSIDALVVRNEKREPS